MNRALVAAGLIVAVGIVAVAVSPRLLLLDDPESLSYAPPLGWWRLPVRISRPFARLRADPLEATFERRGKWLNVFVRCTDPFWARRREVVFRLFDSSGGSEGSFDSSGGSEGSFDCPGGLLPRLSAATNITQVERGDPVWVRLDVRHDDGSSTRVMRGFVAQPDGRLAPGPKDAATPEWWDSSWASPFNLASPPPGGSAGSS